MIRGSNHSIRPDNSTTSNRRHNTSSNRSSPISSCVASTGLQTLHNISAYNNIYGNGFWVLIEKVNYSRLRSTAMMTMARGMGQGHSSLRWVHFLTESEQMEGSIGTNLFVWSPGSYKYPSILTLILQILRFLLFSAQSTSFTS